MSENIDQDQRQRGGGTGHTTSRAWVITPDEKVAQYKEQIDVLSTRFQRVASTLIGMMVALLFGFILPVASPTTVDKVSKLRTAAEKLEQEIQKNESEVTLLEEASDFWKGTAPSLSLGRAPRSIGGTAGVGGQNKGLSKEQPVNAESEGNRRQLVYIRDDLQRLQGEFNDLDILGSVEDRPNALKALSESVANKIKELVSLQGKEGVAADPYRATQALATAIQSKLKLAILRLKEEELSSRRVPLDFFGVFGGSIEGLKVADLPVRFLPLVWSAILLGLFLFWVTSRVTVLNLYARLVRRALGVNEGITPARDHLRGFLEVNSEELLGETQCRWWWLAPLPRWKGAFLRSDELRAALGWTRIHGSNMCIVATIGLALVTLQFLVLQSGLRITDTFENEKIRWIFRAAEWSMALTNASLILLALLAIGNVPDFGTNQEDIVQMDRRALLRITFTVIVLAPFTREIWARRISKIDNDENNPCVPRFRRRKSNRLSLPAERHDRGFYKNRGNARRGELGAAPQQIIHYLAPKGHVISTTEVKVKGGTRRIPFQTRAERARYRAQVAAWRRSGAELEARPRRDTGKESSEGLERPCSGAPFVERPQSSIAEGELVFRDASNLDFMRLELLGFGEVLKELQAAKMSDRSLVDSRSIGNLRHGGSIARLHSGRFVFAVEQEVVRLLSEPARDVESACEFLIAAIDARGPRLDALRLYDLLAALSFRNRKEAFFERVLHRAHEYGQIEYGSVEFSARAARWGDVSGTWRQRWATTRSSPENKTRDAWAGLPM